jgi:2-(3-amino-3-carboxypropyl)histidine synthase
MSSLTLNYDLEIDRLLDEITRRSAKRVLIQIPDGLKPIASKLSKIIEKETSADVFVSSSACYGACDIAINQARLLGADLIVHYGHTQFAVVDGPSVVFLDARSNLDLTPILEKVEHELAGWRTIGVATTLQHLDELDSVKDYWNRLGIEVMVTPKGGHNIYIGQIIGCDYTPLKMVADKVEAFLIMGSRFHGLGAALAVKKPVIQADPYSNQVTNMNKIRDTLIRRRYAAIDKAKEAKDFAVIVGTKPGQYDLTSAMRLKKMISSRGKNAIIIAGDEILPESFQDFEDVEVFVNTSCPRLALDDAERFSKPILLPREVLVAIGELTWEELLDQGLL